MNGKEIVDLEAFCLHVACIEWWHFFNQMRHGVYEMKSVVGKFNGDVFLWLLS